MAIEKIFVLHHTHVDFGYTDLREVVEGDLIDMVESSLDLAIASASRPEPERFRWVHEGSWPVLRYLERSGARRDELFGLMREGRIELTALYMNPTDLFDRETLEISTEYAAVLARDNSLPLDTAMFGDCPGLPWSMPDILSRQGVRYLSAAPDFIMSYPLEVERPFYWEGPDGGRVLTWFTDWRNWWYAEGLFALKLHEEPVSACERLKGYVKQLEGEGYRWKGLAIHVAIDNVGPKAELMDFVAAWNAARRETEVRLATNHDFFSYMEREHGNEFAVHRAAWPDWWANGHAAAAYETSCSRQAKASLRRSAALARKLGCAGEEGYRADREDALGDVLMFDEHTWGDSRSVRAPWGVEARLGWSETRGFALRGLRKARSMEGKLLSRIDDSGTVVFNPEAEDFHGPILLPASSKGRRAPELVACADKSVVVGQRARPGETAGAAGDWYMVDVPAGAARVFTRRRRKAIEPQSAGLETEYYRIEGDAGRGHISGVFDKCAGRDLLDPSAEWGFGELVHERARSRLGRRAMYDISLGSNRPDAKRPRPEFIRLGGDARSRAGRLVTGPVYTAQLIRGKLPGVAFEREVRMYRGVARVDVFYRLQKRVNTEYESLYVSFPFGLASPAVWVENAGAVFQAGREQLPGSATDWLSVGEYAAATDGETTVVLAPHHAPLIQVGEINTGKWQKRLEVTRAHLYSWVMNNMWFTNFPAYQEGVVTLAWSLTSHGGGFDRKRAERFAAGARVGMSCCDFAAEAGSVVW